MYVYLYVHITHKHYIHNNCNVCGHDHDRTRYTNTTNACNTHTNNTNNSNDTRNNNKRNRETTTLMI